MGIVQGFRIKSTSTSVTSVFAIIVTSVKGKMLKIAGPDIKPASFSKSYLGVFTFKAYKELFTEVPNEFFKFQTF